MFRNHFYLVPHTHFVVLLPSGFRRWTAFFVVLTATFFFVVVVDPVEARGAFDNSSRGDTRTAIFVPVVCRGPLIRITRLFVFWQNEILG